MSRAIAIAAVLALAPGAAAAQDPAPSETPAQELFDRAKQKFFAGDYKDVIRQIGPLLYPNLRLSSEEDLVEAHLLLGAAHFEEGDRDAARVEIEEALKIDLEAAIGPPNFSPQAVAFFREVRKGYLARTNAAREAAKDAAFRRALESAVLFDRHQFYINFIPFGAGQFQNGHRWKGIGFFVGQTVFGGTSLGLYLYQVLRYGFSGGEVPQGEVDSVRRVQVLQVATGGVALALMIWGILDAWANYEPQVSRPLPEDIKQDVLDLFRATPEPQTRGWLRLVPSVGPDFAGASLSVEF